jgi:hypothetical protein
MDHVMGATVNRKISQVVPNLVRVIREAKHVIQMDAYLSPLRVRWLIDAMDPEMVDAKREEVIHLDVPRNDTVYEGEVPLEVRRFDRNEVNHHLGIDIPATVVTHGVFGEKARGGEVRHARVRILINLVAKSCPKYSYVRSPEEAEKMALEAVKRGEKVYVSAFSRNVLEALEARLEADTPQRVSAGNIITITAGAPATVKRTVQECNQAWAAEGVRYLGYNGAVGNGVDFSAPFYHSGIAIVNPKFNSAEDYLQAWHRVRFTLRGTIYWTVASHAPTGEEKRYVREEVTIEHLRTLVGTGKYLVEGGKGIGDNGWDATVKDVMLVLMGTKLAAHHRMQAFGHRELRRLILEKGGVLTAIDHHDPWYAPLEEGERATYLRQMSEIKEGRLALIVAAPLHVERQVLDDIRKKIKAYETITPEEEGIHQKQILKKQYGPEMLDDMDYVRQIMEREAPAANLVAYMKMTDDVAKHRVLEYSVGTVYDALASNYIPLGVLARPAEAHQVRHPHEHRQRGPV